MFNNRICIFFYRRPVEQWLTISIVDLAAHTVDKLFFSLYHHILPASLTQKLDGTPVRFGNRRLAPSLPKYAR